jgi:predicted lysophospholipase L1 biosynthesis ABC-type transport system permease subunit
MKALLYLRLLTEDQTIAYGNPLLEQVKNQFPEVAVLDVDSQSGELVLHYAKQLLQNSERLIVCIDSSASDAGFGSVFPLLELVLEGRKEQLIVFRTEHTRLQRMVQARPELQVKAVQDDAELLQEVQRFYT